jgi:curved DNA-binding protein
MAVQYKDYYEILGVSRDASRDEIQRVYRKLARKYHPDLNKKAGSEDKFKEINEAYEVLKDPEKRNKYDQIGSGWQQGDNFRPPPGWEHNFDFGSGPQGRQENFFWSSDGGDYSDFFESLFGGQFQQGFTGLKAVSRFPDKAGAAIMKRCFESPWKRPFAVGQRPSPCSPQRLLQDRSVSSSEKRYDVKIPPGILAGQKIRLSGQGGKGSGGGGSGDLFLKVEIEPHPRFRLKGRDLYTELPITPWEAALGANIDIQTLSEPVTLKVPAGTQSGQKLRLRAKGMPNPKGTAGDLYVVMQIKVPKSLSKKERELFNELNKVSAFKPRG